MERTILHCDCNSFYASVECVHHPELREVPMAVCGNPADRRGIILAKNEPAKRYGILTAETVWQAKRKCPQLVLVAPRREEYQRFSECVNEIYQQYTDRVEPFSIDESWLDVTGCEALFGSGAQVADTLRRRVREEVGLTISVGVSFNKVFAKMGSDYQKPDATTLITRENFRAILFPLPVTAMLFVGSSAAASLKKLSIHTIGELAASRRERVAHTLGKLGETIWDYANGLDNAPVAKTTDQREIKSIGNSLTFRRNLQNQEDIRAGVLALADSVAARLRAQGKKAGSVHVVIKDPDFKVISRQMPLPKVTDLSCELSAAALALIEKAWRKHTPIRMLSVTAAHLTGEESQQLSFFEAENAADRKKQQHLETALDTIRGKFGNHAVLRGNVLKNDLGIGEFPEQERGEK